MERITRVAPDEKLKMTYLPQAQRRARLRYDSSPFWILTSS
jgi:hypothetical protein